MSIPNGFEITLQYRWRHLLWDC